MVSGNEQDELRRLRDENARCAVGEIDELKCRVYLCLADDSAFRAIKSK